MSEHMGMSRRGLMRAAAGAFVLTASGLYVPDAAEEAEAREGTFDAKVGGRHGKDHRGRDRGRDRDRHRRDRDKEPDRDPPKGIFDNDIQFIFVNNNDAGSEPIGVTCEYWRGSTLDVIDKTAMPGAGVSFNTASNQALLYIDHNRHIVWAESPFFGYPTIKINSAGNRGGAGPKDMDEGDTLSWQHGNYKIDVQRLPDSSTYKVFTVSYQS